jgi:hypothetical protein
MSENSYETIQQGSGGNKKLWVIIGGVLIFGLIAMAVFGLFLAYSLGWFGGGSDIIVGFPDEDNNFDLYLVTMGDSEDEGVRLLKEAPIEDSLFYIFQEYGIAKMIQGAGFVPDSQYIFLSYTDDDESVFEQMKTNEDEPDDLFSSDAYPFVVAFPEQETVMIVEYSDDEVRCYAAPFGEEADRLAKGFDCLLLPDGENMVVVEEDEGEYTFTAVNTTTEDENEFLVLEAMLDIYMVSPDGTFLAYLEAADDEMELHMVDIAGEDDEKVADGFGIPDLGFAPTTNDFYYIVEDDEGNLALYVNDENDPIAEGMMMSAQFGPHGEHLIYIAGDEPDDLVVASYSLKDEESVEIADGEGLQFAVIQNPASVVVKETSDDGDETYYASSPDGEDVEEIMDMKDVMYSYVWSAPGHDYVYLVAYTEDGASAFAYPIGGEGYFFVEEWSDVVLLNVSPNNKYLAFSGVEDEGDDAILYYVDLAAEDDPEELDDDVEWIENAVFTKNSKELLYTATTGSDYDEVGVNLVAIDDPDPDTLYDEAYLLDAAWANVDPFEVASFSSLQVGESYCPGAVTLSVGDPVDASLGEGETLCFRFSTGSDEVWHIDVDSSDGEQDLDASLLDREGNELAYSDDGVWDYDPWLAINFPSGGVYYVEVSDLNGVAGDITIELLEGEESFNNAEEMEIGEEVVGTITFDPPLYLDSPEFEEGPIGGLAGVVYKVELEAGTTATFSVTNEDDAEIYMLILDEDRYWIEEDDSASDYGESTLIFTPLESGSFYLMLAYFSEVEPETVSMDFYLYSIAEAAVGDDGGYFGEISYGETVFGDLSNGARDQWEFYGYADETVLISLESNDFDSFLELQDPYGTQVAYDDDSGGDRNSEVEYTLLESGYYTIVARSYGDSGSGEYELSLEEVIIEAVEPGESGGTIVMDGMVNGSLADGAEGLWEFEGAAGDVISIFLYSEEFDCVVELLDPDGNEVAYDDDSGENGDSLISDYELETSGTFTIVARAYGNSGSGAYELYLYTDDGAQAEPTETPEGQEGNIEYGDSMTTTLVAGAEDFWVFEGSEGDAITISLSSEDFDAYLELYDEDDTLIAYNDDGAGTSDSLLWGVVLPETGGYAILARSYGNTFGGEYTLELEEETFPIEASLDYGDSETFAVEPGEHLVFSFSGTTGDVISIAVESEDFDTYLELRDDSGNVLESNDDADGTTDSMIISFELTDTGTYLIVASAYRAYDEGDLTVSLTQN